MNAVCSMMITVIVASEKGKTMSISRWFYKPGLCDGNYCCGDCDKCDIQKNPEQYEMTDEEEEEKIIGARKGEE